MPRNLEPAIAVVLVLLAVVGFVSMQSCGQKETVRAEVPDSRPEVPESGVETHAAPRADPPTSQRPPRLGLGIRWDWLFSTPDRLPSTPLDPESAKADASVIYADHRATFFCQCPYDGEEALQLRACGYRARADEERARAVAWERVVPIHAFGQHRRCWSERICTSVDGKPASGVECCREVDAQFRKMESDLQNYVPAVGEVEADRANYRFGDVAGEPRLYGRCDFEVDRWAKVAEPADSIRGDIARIYLYMHYVYDGGLPLEPDERERFATWHREDPPDGWERERNRRIAEIQGSINPLVH